MATADFNTGQTPTGSIPPIPTRYAGFITRSRLEARWMCFFANLELKFEYENYSFRLSDGTFYLPDFWFPQIRMWGEVKPTTLSVPEQTKVNLLAVGTGFNALMLVGSPDFTYYWGAARDQDYATQVFYSLDIHRYSNKKKLAKDGELWSESEPCELDADDFSDRYKQSVWAAQGESFSGVS